MAALQGAIAVAQHQNAALAVAERLHFHMPGRNDRALHKQPGIAELRLCEALHRGEAFDEFRLVLAVRHADATAASGALQHHRIADACRPGPGVVHFGQHVATGQQSHANGFRQRPRFVLKPEGTDLRRRRANEPNAARFKRLCERRVFAQEAVARVYGVGAGLRDGLLELGLIQIGVRNAAFAKRHGLLRRFHVQRMAICLCVHRHAADAEGVQRATDAHGDLAAIGDEHFLEHARTGCALCGTACACKACASMGRGWYARPQTAQGCRLRSRIG